jgi:hypothetical protein
MTSQTCSVTCSHIASYDIDDDCLMIDINYSQVQPDVGNLLQGIEDNEDSHSHDSELLNLGKLEYSLDYDFQKQEV